jgi:hypothetical protein
MKASIDLQTARRIQKFGKEYKPALLPPDLRRGRVGWCFDDSIIQLTDEKLRQKYRYVEGIARSTPDEPLTLHAWLTDGIHAYDPTWWAFGLQNEPRVVPGFYLGIEMPALDVMRFMSATTYQGVISNGWRNKPLAKKCVPAGFRITRECHNHSQNPKALLIGID